MNADQKEEKKNKIFEEILINIFGKTPDNKQTESDDIAEDLLCQELLQLCRADESVLSDKTEMLNSLIEEMENVDLENVPEQMSYEVCINISDKELNRQCREYNKSAEEEKIRRSIEFYEIVLNVINDRQNVKNTTDVKNWLNGITKKI